MTEATRYPIDFEAAKKGDVFGRKFLEDITGESDDYRLQQKLVELSARIERELWARGKRYTVRIKQFTIEILDDATASTYNHKAFRKGIRRMKKSHRRQLAVDSTSLTQEQQARLLRRITTQGAILACMSPAIKAASPMLHVRSTPGLPNFDQASV